MLSHKPEAREPWGLRLEDSEVASERDAGTLNLSKVTRDSLRSFWYLCPVQMNISGDHIRLGGGDVPTPHEAI